MRHFLLISIILSCYSFNTAAQAPVPDPGKAPRPLVLWEIHEIQSALIGEKRVLNIYLPEGYNDTTRYAVTYLLDGSIDEDFIHVAGLYQFNQFEWINRVPKTIVVGIATIDRRGDFTFPTSIEGDNKAFPTSGKSANFIAFIEKELQPYIEHKFNSNGSKTIIGQSLGGLLATEILLKNPDLFSQYIIISPSLWRNNGSLLKQSSALLQENFSVNTNVYIGVGKEGLTPGKNARVMEVDANLLAERIKGGKSKAVKVYFDYLPAEDHATIAHQAIYNALVWLHSIR